MENAEVPNSSCSITVENEPSFVNFDSITSAETNPATDTTASAQIPSSLATSHANEQIVPSLQDTVTPTERTEESSYPEQSGREAGESNISEDYDSWIDVLGSSSSQESLDDPITYTNKLRRNLFLKSTAKQRRKDYIRNRSKASFLRLSFTGSFKTQFWQQYGITTHEKVPTGKVHSITSILTKDELSQMGPMERRLHVNGQKFTVVPNSFVTHSLYRAIAQAVGMSEDLHERIRATVLYQISLDWPLFCQDVCKIFEGKVSFDPERMHTKPEQMDPHETVKTYKKLTANSTSLPIFELTAAALHFGFTYSVMEFTSSGKYVWVRNCKTEAVNRRSKVKYNFLKTGMNYEYFEFLVPIGPLTQIPDGTYPTVLRDVVLIECSTSSTKNTKRKYRPEVGRVPVGFALDHRVFFHRSTISHDLWSMLAELVFKRLMHAPEIKKTITENKHDFALYYLACKAKKRYLVTGNPSIEKLASDFEQRFSSENPRGDLQDLHEAALEYYFSYTIIGVDARGNFFWRDYVSEEYQGIRNIPYFAFFLKQTPDKNTFWYALEDMGRLCLKEQRLYEDVQFGDLSLWGGRFYFHDTPKRFQTLESSYSSIASTRSSVKVLESIKDWVQSSLTMANEKISDALNAGSRVIPSGAIVRSLIQVFTRNRRVSNQEINGANLEKSFTRDKP